MKTAGSAPSSLRAAAGMLGCALACALLLLPAGPCRAQPSLALKGVVVNWPVVKLQFSVQCGGKWSDGYAKRNFEVYEDGNPIRDFELVCPERRARCPITVSLVLDATASMAGEKNFFTRRAAREFIANMDGAADRAAVLWFNTRDTVRQAMTADTTLLRLAVDSLPAMGQTAVWDAAYDGIAELVANSSAADSCRAVVLLTDGQDNSSVRSLDAVVAYARANGVRVFAVGLGGDANEAALGYLASSTGARYFRVNSPQELSDIYAEIFMEVAGIEKCEIAYTSVCGDGSTRVAELRLVDFCGGGASDARSFQAPFDGVPPQAVTIAVRTVAAPDDSIAIVPIDLRTALNGDILAPSEVTIRFDTTCAAFLEALAPDSCLLHDAGLTATPLPDGVVLRTARRLRLREPGVLALLRLRTRAQPQSRSCSVRIDAWQFAGGCRTPVLEEGELRIVASEPRVACTVDAPPLLAWNRAAGAYDPSPFTLRVTLRNAGDKPAIAPVYTLDVPAGDIEIVAPATTQQRGVAVLEPDSAETVAWLLRPRPRGARDTLALCVRASFDNLATLPCCAAVVVDAADAARSALSCALAFPPLTVDTARPRYLPSPATLLATVANDGDLASDSVSVVLQLPPGWQAEGGAGTPPPQRLLPPVLAPGQRGTASWRLLAAVSPAGRSDTLRVRAAAGAAAGSRDETSCEAAVSLPPVAAPELSCLLSASPDTLRADGNGGDASRELRLDAMVTNAGLAPRANVRAALLAPDSAAGGLFVPAASDTQRVKTIPVLFPGQTRALAWTLRLARDNDAPAAVVQRFRLALAADGYAEQGDACVALVAVDPARAARPLLSCRLEGTDTARFADSAYAPPLLALRLRVENTGDAAAEGVRAYLLHGGGVTAESPPVADIGRLEAGSATDSLRMPLFLLRVLPAPAARNDTQRVLLVAENAASARCEHLARIDAERAPAIELHCAVEPDTLRYDAAAGTHLPATCRARVRLRNAGDGVAVDGELRLAGMTRLAPVDSLPVLRFGSLAPGEERVLECALRPMCDGGDDSVTATLRARGGFGNRIVAAACAARVRVEPCLEPRLEAACSAPDSLRYDAAARRYEPQPFLFRATVTNTGRAPSAPAAAGIDLSPAVLLDSGEVSPRILPALAPGGSADLAWRLIALPQPAARAERVCLRAGAEQGNAACCAVIAVPAAGSGSDALAAECAGPDTLRWNAAASVYEPDPVPLCVTVTNAGARDADSVTATLLVRGRGITLLDAPAQQLAARLRPGERSVAHCWRLRVAGRDTADALTAVVLVSGAGGAASSCARAVSIAPATLPRAACELRTEPADTLVFDYAAGDFAGIPQAGARAVLRVEARILPPPGGTDSLAVLLEPPEGVSLAGGDALRLLAPGATDTTLQWTARPVRADTAALRRFALRVIGGGTAGECDAALTVGAAPNRARLTLPEGLAAAAGDRIVVPLRYDGALASRAAGYAITLSYDASQLRFVRADARSTLTGGWEQLPAAVVAADPVRPGCLRVAVSAATSHAPIAAGGSGALLLLSFDAVYGRGDDRLSIAVADLRFPADAGPALALAEGDDAPPFLVEHADGRIVLSGDCILPLRAGPGYALGPNRPNPFNPSTVIAYAVPAAVRVQLTVVDALGRIVRTLVDADVDAGAHTAVFDAGGLPAGLYFYRMEAPGFTAARPMLLVR